MTTLLKIIVFVLLVCFFLSNQIIAQPSGLNINHIGLEDGLSQSTIYAIAQDSEGFIWFGTQDGLNRYDGYSITIYKHNPYDSNSLSDNTIWSLLNDGEGNLWIGTMAGGVNRYSIRQDKYFHYLHDEKDSTSISGDFVSCMFKDSHGDIWLGTNTGGLNRYIRNTNSFEHFKYSSSNKTTISNNSIHDICEDNDNNLWVGTSDGLCKINIGKQSKKYNELSKLGFKRYLHSSKDSGSISANYIRALYVDNQGKLWIGTWGGGLNYYIKNSGKFNHSNYKIRYRKNKSARTNKYLNGNFVASILEDSQNNLWVATYDSGLTVSYNKTNLFTPCIQGAIMKLYKDRSGNIWIGTFTDGVKMYDPRKNSFVHFYNSDTKSSNNINLITSILEDNTGKLWIGTYGAGLVLYSEIDKNYSEQRKKIRTFTFNSGNPNSISSNRVISLCESKDNNIWLGTEGGGVNRYNKNNKSFIHYHHKDNDSNSIAHDQISYTYYDKMLDVIWIGFLNGGIDYFDYKNNIIVHYNLKNKSDEIINNAVAVIYRGEESGLWAGTIRGGIFHFDNIKNINSNKIGVFKKYFSSKAKNKGLNDNSIFSIYEDGNGKIWFGTYGGGLDCYHPKDNSFTYFTEENGLPDNIVYGILPDKKGNLWMSTNKGISEFNPLEKIFRNYDAKDGLQSNEFTQGAYFAGKDGELFFGGVNGFNSFYPESIIENNYLPPVYLTDFKVFDKSIPLNNAIADTRKIVLSYSQNFFSFKFVALNYTAPEKNKYAYKLEGFDNDWHYVSAQQRFASYTNLDPGKYTLHIIASNNDQIWNKKGTWLTILVTPPYWMTWWFRSIVIFFILAIGILIYYRRIISLKKDKILQQEISKRIIEKQEEERSRIALEMHDVLGQDLLLIKNRLLLAIPKAKISNVVYENLNKISDDISKVLKTVREISHNLHPPDLDQLGLTEAIKSILYAMRKATKLKVNGEIDNIDGLIPAEMEINLVRIIQEATGNILKHSEATEYRIEVKKFNELILVEIFDNGKGFDVKSIKTKHWRQSGLGLIGMTERVRILNGTFDIKSIKGEGTKIKIQIPYSK